MEQIKPVETQQITTRPQKATAVAPKAESAKPSQAAAAPSFVSPKGRIDAESGVFVVQIRNTSTGEVSFQYPAKKAANEYTRSEKLSESKPAEQPRQEAKVSQDSDVKSDATSTNESVLAKPAAE